MYTFLNILFSQLIFDLLTALTFFYYIISRGKPVYENMLLLLSSLLDSDMPDHDLEPPRFAQLALERVLQDWNALKSMIMFGSQENKDPWVSQQTAPPALRCGCNRSL